MSLFESLIRTKSIQTCHFPGRIFYTETAENISLKAKIGPLPIENITMKQIKQAGNSDPDV